MQYSGSLSQTINFWEDKDKLNRNLNAVETLIKSFRSEPSEGFEFKDPQLNEIKPKKKDIIVDVGSNDNTLLNFYESDFLRFLK